MSSDLEDQTVRRMAKRGGPGRGPELQGPPPARADAPSPMPGLLAPAHVRSRHHGRQLQPHGETEMASQAFVSPKRSTSMKSNKIETK